MGNATDIREAVEEELGHDPLVESAVAGLTGVRNISNEIGYVFDVDPADVSRLGRQALDRHKVPGDQLEITG